LTGPVHALPCCVLCMLGTSSPAGAWRWPRVRAANLAHLLGCTHLLCCSCQEPAPCRGQQRGGQAAHGGGVRCASEPPGQHCLPTWPAFACLCPPALLTHPSLRGSLPLNPQTPPPFPPFCLFVQARRGGSIRTRMATCMAPTEPRRSSSGERGGLGWGGLGRVQSGSAGVGWGSVQPGWTGLCQPGDG